MKRTTVCHLEMSSNEVKQAIQEWVARNNSTGTPGAAKAIINMNGDGGATLDWTLEEEFGK